MTQEDKELLLKDIAARLLYGVKLKHIPSGEDTVLEMIGYGVIDGDIHDLVENFRPYLRPMSSMTEDEKIQLSQYACIGEDLNGEFIDEVQRKDCAAYIDWLNAHHFDYRGLIEKSLALEAPKYIYKI